MDNRYLGIPIYVWAGAAGILLYFGWKWHQSSAANATTNAQSAANGPSSLSVVADDQTQNLPEADTWPMNQLALPYNYGASNVNGTTYTNAQSPNFVGYQNTPVLYAGSSG